MGGPEPTQAEQAEQEREQQESLARIEAGGIPLSAERRLKELAAASGRGGAGGGSFTSDLSVNGFALCHQLGLKPLSQVMGSSVYQVGYAGMTAYDERIPVDDYFHINELRVLSDAWNEARRLALNRLWQEAAHAGAQAVLGVQTKRGAYDWAEGAIEYMVVGTAVRDANAAADSPPVLTELSVSEFANLRRAGIEPLGIAAWTSAFYAPNEPGANFALTGASPLRNYEQRTFTQAVYTGREVVMQRLGQQAQQLGASGIVGVRVGHRVSAYQPAGMGQAGSGVVITFDAIGTAVRDSATASVRPPQINVDLSDN